MKTLSIIESAVQFVRFMEMVWDEDPSGMYNEWHNARMVAKSIGAVNVAPSSRDGVKGYLYRLVDGSRVFVLKDGTGIAPASPVVGKGPRRRRKKGEGGRW
jgi:hypothetical protein